ncbi:MAG TPA: AraC family transcriptional regulator [Clostridiales bacterium]|nr:AraC family transcriptional regulator [Clostridiales bacterium]
MDVHVFKSSTFRKTLISYTVILMIPVFVFFYISLKSILTDNRQKLIDIHTDNTQRLANTIDSKLIELMQIGDRLYYSKWINKLMMDIDTFDSEFNVLKKQEICQDLNNYVAFSGVLSNIIIVFPRKDIVVSQNAWYQVHEYFHNVLKIKQEDIENIYSYLQDYTYFKTIDNFKVSTEDNLQSHTVVLRSLELNTNPRAVVLFFINDKYLNSYIEKIMPPNLNELTITSSGTEIFSFNRGKMDDSINLNAADDKYPKKSGNSRRQNELSVFTAASSIALWEYKCIYDDTGLPVHIEQLLPVFLGIIFTLITGTLLALVLALISYKPLYSLFNKIFKYNHTTKETYGKHLHEYTLIENSFNKLIDEKESILIRIKNYEDRMKSYESAARSNLLLRLLKGYFEDIEDPKVIGGIRELGLNYTNDDYFCVTLMNINKVTEIGIEETVFKRQEIIDFLLIVEQIMNQVGIDCQILDALDNVIVVIMKFNQSDSNEILVHNLFSKIENISEIKYSIKPIISIGKIEKGIIGISKSYQMSKENLGPSIFGAGTAGNSINILNNELYYYPTDWEIQLINNLKIGNLDAVTRIIDEIRLENEKRNLTVHSLLRLLSLIMETELRVIAELNIDIKFYQDTFNNIINLGDMKKSWSYIYEVSSRICDRSQYVNTESNLEVGNTILKYINDNFDNPCLSLKELAQEFSMSASSLSKLFKEVTGINYYDYLCRLRIDKAKKLLEEPEYNISSIASKVGYENENSFRRTFKRYEGIAPNDYISKITSDNSSNN